MAGMNNKQTVQGGAILDALSKLFFKGLDNIFDAAVEYEKEMGVLKQVNKISVKDKKGKEYTLIVKLAPVKDKEGVFYVEVECPDFPEFNASDDTINKHAVQLNKSDKSKSDFEDLVDKIIKKNGLMRVKAREDGKGKADSVVETFEFYDKDSDDACKVSIAVSVLDNKIHVLAEGDPALAAPFDKTTTLDETSSVGTKLETHLDSQCNLSIDATDEDRWDNFVDILNHISEWGNDIVDNIKELVASSGIRVTLEKVIADGHETINLVNIIASSYTRKDTLTRLGEIVASDDFVDNMPEGESTYKIVEDDDFYDIDQI